MRRNNNGRPQTNPNPRRLVLSVVGKGGGGKTNLLLTAPEPNLLLYCDPNTTSTVEKVFKSPIDDIDPDVLRAVHCPYPLSGFEAEEDQTKDDAWDAWTRLRDELNDVYDDRAKPMPKVVSIDNGTEFDRLNVLAEFGRTDKISPITRRNKMGPVNDRFRAIFRICERAGVHVVITHRCRDVWETVKIEHGRRAGEEEDRRIPGVYERIGFREMENIINCEVLTMHDPTREGKLSDKFGIRILASRQRPGVIGNEYWGKQDVGGTLVHAATFQFIGTLFYPDSKLSDWE